MLLMKYMMSKYEIKKDNVNSFIIVSTINFM